MDFLRNPEIRKLVKVYVFLTVFEVLGAAVLSLVLCGSSSSSGSSSGRGAGVSLSVAMAAAALYVFLTCAVNAGLFFYFTRKRYDGISELSSRLDQILHGAVSMDFVPDREGELAVLTSEIYKMTVRLRDQAETLKREKVYLRDSLADISHQLRTPLTSIHLLASRLQREDLESRERADTARNISRLLSRMEWLISSLLKIAKLESDTIAFRQTRVSVGDLIRETEGAKLLLSADTDLERTVPVEIAAYTEQMPDLREEYEAFALVQFMPESVFREAEAYFSAGKSGAETETIYYKILAEEQEQIPEIHRSITKLLDGMGGEIEYELENRPEKENYNARVMRIYKLLVGILCTLLALIGLANVFAATLGGICLRRREFARYLSVGMTPRGVGKMMCLEALYVVARPVLLGLPLQIGFVLFAVRASHIRLTDFLEAAPVLPLTVFLLFLLACVGAAYAAAGMAVYRGNIMDLLKDDALR